MIVYYISDIEDLTHKTGNFKQFDIFLNMIESALRKVCFFQFFYMNYPSIRFR